ncbi:hypothetical protein SAMN04488109_1354 [Chryseolinea serpens]|uniref:SH3 domain-containing protein n=1 Tax=Chryseolinea serpens TaxID=947013 RepID=A0A1M5LR22_9BACT|nr:hypothetical protein [Chryseolinea serpens]SHG67564.1 hypothetical protein SAMN04488109_1354 [Chryseolinea serpens]
MRIWLFAFIGLSIKHVQAAPRYMAGDSLYVWTLKKLQVRDKDGKVIGALSYGDRVMMLHDDENIRVPIQALPSSTTDGRENPAVMVWGSYVEVGYRNLSGYVFDAYLLKFPPLKTLSNGQREFLPDYFARAFGLLKTVKDQRQDEPFQLQKVYNNGITYARSYVVCCWNTVVMIPDFSMTEAIVFLNYVGGIESYFKDEYIETEKPVIGLEGEQGREPTYVSFTFELQLYSLRKVNDYLIITDEGGD